MQKTDLIVGFLDKVLWRNSAFCQSILEQVPVIQSGFLIHGDRALAIDSCGEQLSDLDSGTGEAPSLALAELQRIILQDFAGEQLKRVYLVSDERGVQREQLFKCDDGFLHSAISIQQDLDIFDFVFGNIEHRHVLAVYSADSARCSFTGIKAAIVSVFDGEGFMLLRK